MRPRRLGVEQLESRVVLSGLGPVLGPPSFEWVSVIASLHDQAGPPQAVAPGLVNQMGGKLGHVYEHALSGFSAQLPSPAFDVLSRNPQIKTVELDMLLHTMAQTVPTGVERIGTLESSMAGIGSQQKAINVGIAILDTGIQSNHPDLNVVGGVGFRTISTGPPSGRGTFPDTETAAWTDKNGHGTHVAGIAAALNNEFGVVGVAPGARLYAVKVLGDGGSGNMSDIIAGVDWVTDNAADIEVANMSLGGVGWSPGLYTAIQNSVAAGMVYVVAAGNNGSDIHGSDKTFGTSDDFIPAAYAEVATISAFVDTDGQPGGDGPAWYWSGGNRWLADDTFADFSNFSNSDEVKNQAWLDQNIAILGQQRHELGLGIDLVMPGVAIESTYLNGDYATLTGTSMAAPHAAGLAALRIAANPRPEDAGAEWVYGVRQALIDMGNPWRSPLGLVSPDPGDPKPDNPDKYEENVGWAGPKVVEIGPTVTITEPTDDTLLWDNEQDVTITATVTPPEGRIIEQVEFFVGQTSIGIEMDGANGWSINWDTLAVENGQPLYPDGPYTITAVATDSADKTGSDSIQVHLDNVDEPPMIDIISPTGGIVSGTVAIVADATDDRGVDRVEFFINNNLVGVDEDGSDGWSVAWNSTVFEDGTYTITATAWDTDKKNITSDPVTVTVQNDVSAATMTADLTGRVIDVNRNFWRAEVTVEVVDANADGLLEGATVWGQWNSGSTVIRTTDSNGIAAFDSGNLRRNINSITFTLTDVVLDGYEFEHGKTSITVNQNGSTIVQAAQLDGSSLPWQASLADRSPGGDSPTLPSASAAPAATVAAADDAYRVASSAAPSIAERSPTLVRPDADSPADDLPITDLDAWSVYAADVDQLLAVG